MLELMILLFISFFKTGLLAFGGGLATIPFLKEMIGKYHWFSLNELINMIGISESTPGPLGVNMASYVGNKVLGPFGGLIATLGLIIPSIIVIILIAANIKRFKEYKIVNDVMYILKPAVVGFILCATVDIFIMTFFKESLYNINIINVIIFAVVLVIYQKFKLHPIIIIILCAIIGIILKL